MADRIVIDASVAAKWYLRDEGDVDVAREIRDQLLMDEIELHAPYLFPYEMCSLFGRACQPQYWPEGRPRITLDSAVRCLRHVLRLPIHYHLPDESRLARALELAVAASKKATDAIYVALAEQLDGIWLTADASATRNLPDGFPADRIVLLSALQ